MKRIKVLFVIRTLLRAGAEKMLVNTCNELVSRQNFDIAIYTVHPGNELQDILDSRVTVVGGDVSFHFSLYRKNRFENENYIQFVNQFKPDIIHSHLYYADLLIHSYFYPHAIYFSHQHNSVVKEYEGIQWKNFFKKSTWTNYYEFIWLKKRYRKFKTSFIACSAGTETMLKKKVGTGKIFTLPNSISLPSLPYTNKTITNDVLQIIWVGRLSDAKRPQMAIEIAKCLRDRNVAFHLKMVGVGIHLENCNALIQKHQLESNVQMTGLIHEMNEVYRNADLMIHTALYEGLPMVFAEANSYGIPIISSDCMPHNEILVNGKNGYIIQTNNPKDYADLIEKIKNSPELYAELSKNSIEQSKRFDIKNYVDKLISIYAAELKNESSF